MYHAQTERQRADLMAKTRPADEPADSQAAPPPAAEKPPATTAPQPKPAEPKRSGLFAF